MSLSDIPKFERDNHLKINVYALEKRNIFPVYLSKYTGIARRIHLLLLSDENSWHYCLIKNLDCVLKILLRATNTANSKNNEQKFCEVCLQSVARDKFSLHKSLCSFLQPKIIEMAAKGTTLSFKNWHKTFKCPFVVYADLEAFDVKTEDFDLAAEQMQSGLNSGGASTTVIENQYPCSFGVVLVDVRLGRVKMEKFYRGDDFIAVLMNTLRSWVRWADRCQKLVNKKCYRIGWSLAVFVIKVFLESCMTVPKKKLCTTVMLQEKFLLLHTTAVI